MTSARTTNIPFKCPCLIPSATFLISESRREVRVFLQGACYVTFECGAKRARLFRDLRPMLDGSQTVASIGLLCAEKGYSESDVLLWLRKLYEERLLYDVSTGEKEEEGLSLGPKRWAIEAGTISSSDKAAFGGERIAIVGSMDLGILLVRSLLEIGVGRIDLLLHAKKSRSALESLVYDNLLGLNIAEHLNIRCWKTLDMRSVSSLCKDAKFVFIAASGASIRDDIIAEVSRIIYTRGIKSLLVSAHGTKITLGPLCVPYSGTCCAVEVIRRPTSFDLIQNRGEVLGMDVPVGPASFFASAAHFAVAVATDAWASSRLNVLANRLWSADWNTGELETVRLLKDPRCPVCSRLNRSVPEGRSVDE